MRVAILGNMNNNANNLTRYLRDREIDCTILFYANEASHFTPEADNIDGIDYPYRLLEWGSYLQLLTTPATKIAADLEPFDFLIGSRLAPAYVTKAGRRLDIFMPTGGDIWTVPVYTDLQPKNFAKYLFFGPAQRRGIKNAGAIFFDMTNLETERKISPVVKGVPRYIHPIPCLYYPDFEGETLARRLAASEMVNRFAAIRAKSDLFLVHHVKHLWQADSVKKFDHLQEKGNDRIFHGLARFKAERPGLRVTLLMPEYGIDVDASKALIVQLGIADCVEWISASPRKELMMAIHLADAVIGEIARSWFSYGTILEGMTMNKPVIHNRDDSFFAGRKLYPMLNAHDAESVYQALVFLTEKPDEAKAIGSGGGKWLREVAVGRAINDICALVAQQGRQKAKHDG
jgi:hypothetical protein